MQPNDPIIVLLGKYSSIRRYCDLCSIDLEDAVRVAQELDRIRSKNVTNSAGVDTWWHEFIGTLASLQDLYDALKNPTKENESLVKQARDLLVSGKKVSDSLSRPLKTYLQGLAPDDALTIEEIASDLLDTAIMRLAAMVDDGIQAAPSVA